MKRKELLRYLRSKGCEEVREAGKHSWWQNTKLNKRSAIPKHTEISNILAKKICKDLGVEPIN